MKIKQKYLLIYADPDNILSDYILFSKWDTRKDAYDRLVISGTVITYSDKNRMLDVNKHSDGFNGGWHLKKMDEIEALAYML